MRANVPAAPNSPVASRDHLSVVVTCVIWLLIVFMTVPEGFQYAAPDMASGMPTEGSMLSRIIWLALLAFGAGVTLSRSGIALKLLRRINPYLLLFFALAAASVLWSIEPETTIRRLVRVLTVALDATALAVTSSQVTRCQSVLRPVLTTLLVGSIIFVLVSPDLAIMQSDQPELIGAWHGLTVQKNALGSLAAIGFILWLHAWLNKESRGPLALLGAVVSATCLVNSRSSSSLMATAFASVLMLMLMRSPPGLRRYLPYLIVLFAVSLLAYSLAVLNLVPGSDLLLSPIRMITGKDQTFSGRTAIWAILNEHIAWSPLHGSGYGAYWVQIPTSPSMEMLQRLYFYPTEGHNGYLDVINDLGILGGLCLLGYLVTFLRQGLRIFAVQRPQGALYLTLLFEQLVGNLSESRWFNALCFDFAIMTIATVAMGRTLMDLQLQSKHGATGRTMSRILSPRKV